MKRKKWVNILILKRLIKLKDSLSEKKGFFMPCCHQVSAGYKMILFANRTEVTLQRLCDYNDFG